MQGFIAERKVEEDQFQTVDLLLTDIVTAKGGETAIMAAFFVNLLEGKLGIFNQRKELFTLVSRIINAHTQNVHPKFSVYDCVWALMRILAYGFLTIDDMLWFDEKEFWPLILRQATMERRSVSELLVGVEF